MFSNAASIACLHRASSGDRLVENELECTNFKAKNSVFKT